MKKLLLVACLVMTGCGGVSRAKAQLTGWSKTCVEGVSYLQFSSGATVQYDRSGKVVTCD